MKTRLTALCQLVIVIALDLPHSVLADDDIHQRIAALEQQVQRLTQMLQAQHKQVLLTTERLDVDEKNIATTAAVADEVRVMSAGTKLTYGGSLKLDSIATTYSDGKPADGLIEDFLVSSLIPVSDGSVGSYQSYNMHAKSSQLFVKTATPTTDGVISTLVEMDFAVGDQGNERVSNSWANRMRHAYVKWQYADDASLLAGQTWSTFMNVAARPALLDFAGPAGTIFNRQPMLRLTTGPWMFAIENPRTRLNGEAHDDFSEGIPDLVARYNGTEGNLSWSLAGIARQLTYDNGTHNDTAMGYGLSFAGKYVMNAADIRFNLNYGDALGRYLGVNAFNDGYVNADGSIKTIDQMGGFVAYHRNFGDQWSGGVTLSMAEADNPYVSNYAESALLARAYQSGHVNLIWNPTKQMSIGGELIYGKKELENGDDGSMSRLQMTVKYGL